MTAKQAMSAHLGCDSVRELESDHRYQAAPGKRPVYTCGDYYYTYSTNPPADGGWEPDPDQFYAMQARITIWRKSI